MAYLEEDVYQYFKKEIEDSANKKIEALETLIESIKTKQISLLEEELNDTIKKAKDNELNEMNAEYSAALNRIKVNSHKEVIKKKRDLMESVLLEVKNKLLKFVGTEEYKEKMLFLVKKIDKDFCGTEITFKIMKKDKVLRDIIKNNFKNKYEIIEDDLIKIGGFIAICNEKGILTDQSIDSSLEEKRKWFYENSKFAIK